MAATAAAVCLVLAAGCGKSEQSDSTTTTTATTTTSVTPTTSAEDRLAPVDPDDTLPDMSDLSQAEIFWKISPEDVRRNLCFIDRNDGPEGVFANLSQTSADEGPEFIAELVILVDDQCNRG